MSFFLSLLSRPSFFPFFLPFFPACCPFGMNSCLLSPRDNRPLPLSLAFPLQSGAHTPEGDKSTTKRWPSRLLLWNCKRLFFPLVQYVQQTRNFLSTSFSKLLQKAKFSWEDSPTKRRTERRCFLSSLFSSSSSWQVVVSSWFLRFLLIKEV